MNNDKEIFVFDEEYENKINGPLNYIAHPLKKYQNGVINKDYVFV